MLRTDAVTPVDRAERVGAFVACALALALFAPMAWPIATGRVFLGDDLGRFHLPVRHFYARCLADGDDYRWHPGLYCGVYIHGEGQAGMDHPLHRLLYGTMPLAAAFQLELIAGYPLMFLGMMLWLRRVGLRCDAAGLGSLAFAFSSFMILRYVHMNAVQIVAHLPWVLLAIEATARPTCDRERAWATGGIALLTASQGLLGYPQYLGFSLVVAGLYAACRMNRDWRDHLRIALAFGVGLVAAAAQLLPHLDALRASARSSPTLAFLGTNSLEPINLVQIVAPFAFRQGYYRGTPVASWPIHEHVAYLGAIVPSSCAWLWIRRRQLGRSSSLVIGAATLGAIALILALGRHSPLFPIYARLPVASLFRGPARYAMIAQFCGAVLAAVAVSDLAALAARGGGLPRRWLRPLLVPVAASALAGLVLLAACLARPAGFQPRQIGSIRDMIASAVWIAIPSSLFALAARRWRGSAIGLMLVAAIDSGVMAIGPILRHERAAVPSAIEAVGPGPPSATGRVLGPWNASVMDGARLVDGYVALVPRRRLDYSRPSSLQLAGVAWRRDAGTTWERLARPPLPRARLVGRAVASDRVQDDLERVDPAAVALVDAPIALEDGPPGRAAIREDRPGRIRVETSAPSGRLLVVSEAHHPGWRVEIDGRPTRLVRVYGDFLGCVVPSGAHVVMFRFDPASSRMGRLFSWIGTAAIGVLLIVGLFGARSKLLDSTTTRAERAPKCLTSRARCDEISVPLLGNTGADRRGST